MTIAAFFFGGACALSLFAWALGKMIKCGNEIDEHALPFEPGAEIIPFYQRTDIHA